MTSRGGTEKTERPRTHQSPNGGCDNVWAYDPIAYYAPGRSHTGGSKSVMFGNAAPRKAKRRPLPPLISAKIAEGGGGGGGGGCVGGGPMSL